MPASIWLQLRDDAALRGLIAELAAAHGTMPFQPHLTVCGIPLDDAAIASAAADYVRGSSALPLRAAMAGISCSTTAPFKAVVTDIEDTPQLRAFRSELRQITGAPAFEPPHVSLLYTIDARRRPVAWAGDAARLQAIARHCKERIQNREFVLDRPVVVAPEGEWTNIASWKIVRHLWDGG